MWPFSKKEKPREPHPREHLPPYGSTKNCRACNYSELRRSYQRSVNLSFERWPSYMEVLCVRCGYSMSEQLFCDAEEIKKRNE